MGCGSGSRGKPLTGKYNSRIQQECVSPSSAIQPSVCPPKGYFEVRSHRVKSHVWTKASLSPELCECAVSHTRQSFSRALCVCSLSHSPAFLQSSSHVWHFLLDPMSSATNVRLVPRIIENIPCQGQPMPLEDCLTILNQVEAMVFLDTKPFVWGEGFVIFFLNSRMEASSEGMTRSSLRASHFLS